ncbi:Sec-independent protein translocase protein TatA [Psychrobacter pasteurii]|uniref:Sec-independent protein translocase protein TatA n=1 Tax=Psychrobacter pasteurii TaxID=1945520 RepID=A0A1R4EFX0_9GAMM|nr:twin-arginine translocase TatA/TatE family subunit [Psychrobacter pasteurii]SJM37376.1 Sec-independent protein translocase protein TatA [Psychrobacter pasteurii]
MSLSPMQLLIILGIALLIFGTSKLKNAGKDLGGAVKGFKDAVKDEEEAHAKAKNQPKVIDHETSENSEVKVTVEKTKAEDTHQS